MSRTIQTGCIQTILFNGRLQTYRCTLPIPQEVAQAMEFKHCQLIRGKQFYIRESLDFDELWYWINLMQVTVNDWKIQQLEAKKLRALERCVDYCADRAQQ